MNCFYITFCHFLIIAFCHFLIIAFCHFLIIAFCNFLIIASLIFTVGAMDGLHVAIDGNIITGQNEQSTLTAVQNLVLLVNQNR